MHDYRSPNLSEILDTYKAVKKIGLKNVRIGNIGVFASTEEKRKKLIRTIGAEAL